MHEGSIWVFLCLVEEPTRLLLVLRGKHTIYLDYKLAVFERGRDSLLLLQTKAFSYVVIPEKAGVFLFIGASL